MVDLPQGFFRRRAVASPIPVGVGVGLLVLIATLWILWIVEDLRLRNTAKETEVLTASIISRLDTRFHLQLGGIEHAAIHLSRAGRFSQERIESELAQLHDVFEDFQAINWVDNSGTIRIVTPLAGNEAAQGLVLAEVPGPDRLLEEAREKGALVVSAPLELAQGGLGFVTYFPITRDTGPAGFVNGVFRFHPILDSALDGILGADFVAEVRDRDGALLYRNADEIPTRSAVSLTMPIGDRHWNITVAPSSERIGRGAMSLSLIVIVSGLTVSLAMGSLAYMASARLEKLRRSEERLAYAMEGASEGLWDWDLTTGRTLFSPRWFEMLGYQPDEMPHTHDTFAALLHPEDRDATLDRPRDHATGESQALESQFRMQHKDGHWRHILSRAFIFRQGGKAIRMVGTHVDVTEAHQQQELLADTERLLRDGIEALPVGFAFFDAEERIVLWNRRFPELVAEGSLPITVGDSFEALVRESAQDSVLQVGFDTTEDYVASRLQQDRTGELRWTYRKSDGHWLTAYERSTSGGGFISVMQDITEQESAVAALRQSEAKHAEAVRIARLGRWSADRNGNLKLSPEVFEMVDLDPQEFDGRITSFYRLVHPEDQARVQSAAQKCWETGAEYDCVHRAFTPSGQEVTLRERGEVMRDNAGVVQSLRGTVQDITEQARLEAQLQQARKMEAIGQLTGGLAHDFNNLLAIIQGNAELLLEDFPDAAPMLNSIVGASERGADLAHRLLTFARGQRLSPEPVDIAELARNVHALSNRTLGDQITLDLQLPPDLWVVLVDPGQAENAILNLALNARDAMPDGGRLTITCSNFSTDLAQGEQIGLAPGDYVRVSVQDEGGGMEDDVRRRAFEPFFTTKGHGKGSGLGLSMVYGFARQSGGTVEIQTNPESGTNVVLYLPRTHAAHKHLAEPLAASTGPAGGETILLIEDEPDVRQMADTMLRGAGYRIVSAQDANTAFTQFDAHPEIVAVLSDVMLPGRMLGPGIVRCLREARPDLAVVFMSGFVDKAAELSNPEDMEAILLRKPFRKAQLVEALQTALRNHGRTA
ncbi:PAS domain-containing protein [Tropicimonas sp. TH_r6]|uniref:PAS domain-containing protein n=1 Tax=Tropicimonas sp. TH_r6 TaxID=3082085 RepID=UPI00295359A8|nr:PAS domain-containing protein [Tropicimonas sp. TH_r6]MDV7144247.1 PAS domain-containing protein [Tropicimonas sp. TH_r6]